MWNPRPAARRAAPASGPPAAGNLARSPRGGNDATRLRCGGKQGSFTLVHASASARRETAPLRGGTASQWSASGQAVCTARSRSQPQDVGDESAVAQARGQGFGLRGLAGEEEDLVLAGELGHQIEGGLQALGVVLHEGVVEEQR